MLIPLLTTAVILSFVFINNRITDTKTNLVNKGQMMVQYLAPASEYGIISGNIEYLQSLIQNTLSIPDVTGISIADINGHKIVDIRSSENNFSDMPATEPVKTVAFTQTIFRSYLAIDDLQDTDFSSDDTEFREAIGSVTVEMTTHSIEHSRQTIIRNGITITSSAFIVTLLIALYFSRSIIMPLSIITAGVKRIRDGKLGDRINTHTGGEIATLENDINNMSAALEIAKLKEQQRAQDELFIEKAKAQITLESIGEGVVTTDINGIVTYINPAAENLLGVNAQTAEGLHLHQVFLVKYFTDKQPLKYPISTCLIDGKPIHHESPLLLFGTNNVEFVIRDTATPIRTRGGKITGMVLVFHDFTHIQNISDQLGFQASHDELTGLFNRREFEKQLTEILESNELAKKEFSVCYIDLDHFKVINDTCGHFAGDQALKEVSKIIHNNIRKDDVLARLGGDEFGVIFKSCPFNNALEISNTIKDNIQEYKFKWEQQTFDIGASIGMATINGEHQSLSELMIQADTACYVAKDKGRNHVHVYHGEDESQLKRRGELHWLQRINTTLDENSFELFCQLIMPANNTSDINHYEILIRMKDKDGSLVLPHDFMPAAEHYKLMPKIDRWVFQEFISVIEHIGFFNIESRKNCVFNINLSGQSLGNEGFLEYVISLLESSPVTPEMLTFEITETAAIENYSQASHFINILKKMGCKFALDDFGSGLSSFRYLKELSVDYLKIDGNFIRDIENNPVNQSIVSSITNIATAMKLQTIAEFVETESSLKLLQEYHIDYLQGYAIEMPIPLIKVLHELMH
ncbi:MAG: EAL domain-containing protein [Gammaproteobacteria bacterium]|nr:EAL domain-containing protein [Gammaproteobacteria bacterium]